MPVGLLVGKADILRLLDQRAEQEFGLDTRMLMENAGLAVARQVAALAGADLFTPLSLRGLRVVVFAGGGNNGGDGFAAARHLAQAGAQVRVLFFGQPHRLRGAALANFQALSGFPIEVQPIDESTSDDFLRFGARLADILVDALLGTGSRLPLSPLLRRATAAINGAERPVVAVDLPTGVDADTGSVDPEAVRATCTVTFGLLKPGLLLYPGASYCGEVVLEPISLPLSRLLGEDEESAPDPERTGKAGVPADLSGRVSQDLAWLLTPDSFAAVMRPRRADSHKGTYGHVLVVAGSRGMAGAGRLAAEAALRAGAGLVTLAMPASLLVQATAGLPDCLTLPLPEGPDGRWAAGTATVVLEAARRVDALVIGPGIGQSESVAFEMERLLAGLAESGLPAVLDADALNLLAKFGPSLLPAGLPAGKWVLTPHPGEMARLLGRQTEAVQSDRPGAARAAVASYRQVVVLKGAHTIVADPAGRLWLNPTGNPGMATGGAGDVLAGMIGTYLAQKLPAEMAACLAVYLHGLAGDLAAGVRGEAALIASDIVNCLGAARRWLEWAVAASTGDGRGDRGELPGRYPDLSPVAGKPWLRRPLARWYRPGLSPSTCADGAFAPYPHIHDLPMSNTGRSEVGRSGRP
ncbi:MAG: NAD(P)H-hydrate dehydratase [Limnochordales bacterium]|nr:NAD(P)H-hydrate dehydratase [Limnochordales bacterium]